MHQIYVLKTKFQYEINSIPTTIKESTKPLQYCLYESKYETCNALSNNNFTNNIEFTFNIRTNIKSELSLTFYI